MLERGCLIGVVVATLLLATTLPGAAGNLCTVDKPTSEALATRTSQGSAKLLEAAAHALLSFKAADDAPEGFENHRAASLRLLDDAVRAYKDALSQPAELQRADTFLKNRAFDRLQAAFGITPGTLNHTRWEIIVKTAQTSKTPTAELLSVCMAGAETLKYTMSTVTLGTPASMLRRASTTWFSVLSHGALVSDALDSLVR